MGLSKGNIDVIEEIKALELTSTHKRRLRRRKLRAARAGNLETDSSNIQKDLPDLNTCPNKCVANRKEHVSNKKKKNKCDAQVLNKTQTTFLKETTSINNQNSKYEKLILPNDLKSASLGVDLNKNYKSTSKEPKNHELKSKVPHLIIDQNKLPDSENPLTEVNSRCENLVLKKHQISKLNGNQQIESENLILIENKKNKSDNSFFVQNQTDGNLKLNEKQTVVSQSIICNKNQSPKDLSIIKTHIQSDKDHVLIKEQISQRTKSEISKLDKTESIEKVSPILDKQIMGKIQETPESQTQQEEVTKRQLKKDDKTSSASAKSREEIKAAREAKKLTKQNAKRKDNTVGGDVEVNKVSPKIDVQVTQVKENVTKKLEKTETTKEPVNDLKFKENIPPTDKGKTEDKVKKNLGEQSKRDVKIEAGGKPEETNKSKAELRAERRAKQEAQRASKQETQRATKQAAEQKVVVPEGKDKAPVKSKEEKPSKAKSAEKPKSKTQGVQKVGWFQQLYVEKDKESLNNIPINSNLHPAVVKLGVQLAAGVITGSNARCIALLDAIKKMVRDFSLPARTEFGRGLQSQLAAAAAFLWARRTPAASETNALTHFRRQLTQLPANVDEFDAKKQLQEQIDRYICEQIHTAGEAISLTLCNKISPGDHILTYGCSSLIELVLSSAWAAGVRFRTTVAGARGQRGPEMLRRLRAHGLPATYVDISAISYVMSDVQKVLMGAGALLAHGAALGAAGSALVALVARARNVPVLVACETHKFSERTHLDPLFCHEIGDPDELIDKTDPNSPLKDWRSNPNLTLLNVIYDVTPPSLITAVVTERGILPCTSAPVVLRFKQSEYGI